MNRLGRDLNRFKNGMTDKDAKKLGVNMGSLLRNGFIIRKTIKNSSFLVPEDAPRWATKYKFTRKKYGIKEVVDETVTYQVTTKGKNFLKRINKKSDDSDVDKKSTDKAGIPEDTEQEENGP